MRGTYAPQTPYDVPNQISKQHLMQNAAKIPYRLTSWRIKTKPSNAHTQQSAVSTHSLTMLIYESVIASLKNAVRQPKKHHHIKTCGENTHKKKSLFSRSHFRTNFKNCGKNECDDNKWHGTSWHGRHTYRESSSAPMLRWRAEETWGASVN